MATTELEAAPKQRSIVADDSPFANLLDTNKFEHLWRVSQVFAGSTMVPEHYRGKPSNVLIILQMAFRMGVDPFAMLQQTCVIHGKPGMESKLAIALLNSSGRIRGAIKYRYDGKPGSDGCSCTASCVEASSGELIEHTLTWATVVAEGWLSKQGSKWKTDPKLMLAYRAAHRLCKIHFPEVLMGMHSKEELEDSNTITVQPRRTLSQRLAPADIIPAVTQQAIDDEVAPEPEPEAQDALETLWHALEVALADAESLGDLADIDEQIVAIFPEEHRANAKALVDGKAAKFEQAKGKR